MKALVNYLSKKIRKAIGIVQSFFYGLSARNVGVYASSAAFYIFLSIVPCIMLICSFLPASRLDSSELVEIMKLIMPETVSIFIEELIFEVYDASITVRSISAITTLWSASKALASIMRGIEHVSSDKVRDKYIKLRLRAMLYSVIMILVIYLLIMSTVILNILTSRELITAKFSSLTSPLILAAVLALAYKFIPDKKTPLKHHLPGACTAAVAWTMFTYAYSAWLSLSNSFGLYGSLGSVIITLLWMFFSVYIVLSGAFFNSFIRRFRDAEKA